MSTRSPSARPRGAHAGRRPAAAGLAIVLCCALVACGKSSATSSEPPPVAKQGAVSVVTRNTSRLGGGDPASDAAAVARAIYPGLTSASRPQALVLVSESHFNDALVAAALAASPVGAPLLYSEGSSVPAVSSEAIEALHPSGLAALGGVQVIRVGTNAGVSAGLVSRTVPGTSPAAVAAAVEGLLQRADGGSPPSQVILAPVHAPQALLMPLAGLAAESGAPILYLGAARLPPATLTALASLHHPSLYVADGSAISRAELAALRRFGRVTEIGAGAGVGAGAAEGGGAGEAAREGSGPVANAIALARFTDGSFGWGIKEPGHGLVFANQSRPLDGPAAALLSASGDYAPLLLLEGPNHIPAALASYLSDIQPAYTSAPAYRPVRGVYNHGWLIGDEKAISAVTQAEIDSLLEISPSKQNGEEASGE